MGGINNIRNYSVFLVVLLAIASLMSVGAFAQESSGGSFSIAAVGSANLTVKTLVNNLHSGTAVASDFNSHFKYALGTGSPSDWPGSPAAGSETGTSYSVPESVFALPVLISYSVSEDAPPAGYVFAGFGGDCDEQGNVVLTVGQNKTCIVTNVDIALDDVPPNLTVTKVVVNDNGGAKRVSDFSLFVDGNPVSSGVQTALTAGTHTVGEALDPAYSSTIGGDCAADGKITLNPGDIKSCTITNNDIAEVCEGSKGISFSISPYNINISKDETITFGWWVTACTTPSHLDLNVFAPDGSVIVNQIYPGSTGLSGIYAWVVPFDAPVGSEYWAGIEYYSTSSGVPESSAHIAFLVVPTPKLTIIKTVKNDNGGTKEVSNFPLFIDGIPATSGEAYEVIAAAKHTVSEGPHSGYAEIIGGDCAADGTIMLRPGEEKTCTITNDDIQPILHVIKNVVNDNGGGKVASDFAITVTGSSPSPASFSGVESPGTTVALNQGAYSVVEDAVSGYTKSLSADCSGTITVGEVKTCTITNDDIQPKLVVTKYVVNDNGGIKSASDFTLHVTGVSPSAIEFPGDESGTIVALNAGLYGVDEIGPSGYSPSLSPDCYGKISIGETKNCVITNDDKEAGYAPVSLMVFKHVINDNSGTNVASDFTMLVTGINVLPGSLFAGSELGTTVSLDAGSYSVDESGPVGYLPVLSSTCSGQIADDQFRTCTILNDDEQNPAGGAALTVFKHVINNDGGINVAGDFAMHITGASPSLNDFAGSEFGTRVDLEPGVYSIDESGPSGYLVTISSNCFGVVNLGEQKTCTVMNNDRLGSDDGSGDLGRLVVFKHVVNDDGGTDVAGDFTLFVTNETGWSSFVGSESGTVVLLNGSYSVDEVGSARYVPTFSSNCFGVILPGQTKTCTIINDDRAEVPSGSALTVFKHVVNDDSGTNVASDFTMHVTGTNVLPGSSFAGSELGTSVSLDAGTYSVDESGPVGYEPIMSPTCSGEIVEGQFRTCSVINDDLSGTVSGSVLTVFKHVVNGFGGLRQAGDFLIHVDGTGVVNADFSGDEQGIAVVLDAGEYSVSEAEVAGYGSSLSSNCVGAIETGQMKTCTVVNSDLPARLTVFKHVINDNGGSKTASDFTLHITGVSASVTDFPGDESGTTVLLNAGHYSVDEFGPSGYSPSFSAECAGKVSGGEVKSCVINNDDLEEGFAPVALTVFKHVINDNGGTKAAADFTMLVTGGNVLPGSLFPGSELGTTVSLDAGSYSVDESGPSGYTPVMSSTCSGQIADDQFKTCTILNDDEQNPSGAAALTVLKHVINDNGGTNTSADFTMHITGASPSLNDFPGSESGTKITLDPSTYSVDESGPSGYAVTFSLWCFGSIELGEQKTCTIMNNDQPGGDGDNDNGANETGNLGKLIVLKHVVNDNGGTNLASDFTMFVTSEASWSSFPGSESGTAVMLNGSYSVDEIGSTRYAPTFSSNCFGVILPNQTKTCTIINDDRAEAPSGSALTVFKHVVNDNGGTKLAPDFTIQVTGSNLSSDNFPASESGTTVTLNAGLYAVDETGPAGYKPIRSPTCSGDIAEGQFRTCSIINDDLAGTIPPGTAVLAVFKHVINNNGGAKQANDFQIHVNGTNVITPDFFGDEQGTEVSMGAGAYNVSETELSGYAVSSSSNCIGAIEAGQLKTCTIINDDEPGKLIVTKHVINDNGGSKSAGDFNITVNASNPDPANFLGSETGINITLNAGNYSVDELSDSSYNKQLSANCSGTVANGETKVCVITNDDIAATPTGNGNGGGGGGGGSGGGGGGGGPRVNRTIANQTLALSPLGVTGGGNINKTNASALPAEENLSVPSVPSPAPRGRSPITGFLTALTSGKGLLAGASSLILIMLILAYLRRRFIGRLLGLWLSKLKR